MLSNGEKGLSFGGASYRDKGLKPPEPPVFASPPVSAPALPDVFTKVIHCFKE